jgi:hypothetical protein
MSRLIPIANEKMLEANGIYYRPATLRKWLYTGQCLEIFKKIRGRLYIDANEWQKFVEKELSK